MNSLIGINVRGKTYYFLNTFSDEQLHQLKQFVHHYLNLYPTNIEKDDDSIIEQFIIDTHKLLDINMYLYNIKEILIIK